MAERWHIWITHPAWGKALRSSRDFGAPEAASFYAAELLDTPEIWHDIEGHALCTLIDAFPRAELTVQICLGDLQPAFGDERAAR